ALRRLAGLWVVPGGVAIDGVADDHVVVAGDTLPVTGGVRLARPQVLAPNVIDRKVLVALDNGRVRALRNDSAVPRGAISLGLHAEALLPWHPSSDSAE